MTKPELIILKKGDRKTRTTYRLGSPYKVTETETIPEGFVTDLASIPKIADNLFGIDPAGKLTRPSLIHDNHYATGRWSRKKADKIFYANLVDEGVNRVLAWGMFRLVRIFGGSRYKPEITSEV